jgi:long-subunit fatty acid transport protein
MDIDDDNESEFDRTVFAGNKDVSRGAPSYSTASWAVDLELPAQLGAGVGWNASERLTLAFDVSLTFWPALDDWTITFGEGGLLGNVDSLPPITSLTVPFGWDNQLRISGGGEYWARENVTLRGGLYWESGAAVDESFSPNFPDVGNRVGVTGGFSYAIDDRWEVAAAQEITFFSKRTVASNGGMDGITTFPGEYSLTRWETLVSLGFRF